MLLLLPLLPLLLSLLLLLLQLLLLHNDDGDGAYVKMTVARAGGFFGSTHAIQASSIPGFTRMSAT